MRRYAIVFLLLLGLAGAEARPHEETIAAQDRTGLCVVEGGQSHFRAAAARRSTPLGTVPAPPAAPTSRQIPSLPGAAISAPPVYCADWYPKTVDAAGASGPDDLVQPLLPAESAAAPIRVVASANTLFAQGTRLQV